MEPVVAALGIGAMMPLYVEAALMALAGFSIGLLLAYLVALRRRGAAGRRF